MSSLDRCSRSARVGAVVVALAVLVPVATSSAAERGAWGPTQRVSVGPDGRQANGGSWEPAVSARGRFVAFYSLASNLVARDTNDTTDVFVRDRKLQVTERVSVGPNGRQANGESSSGPDVSPAGRFVAFDSYASNLVPRDTNGVGDVFLRDRKLKVTHRVSVGPDGRQANGNSGGAAVSAGGRFVVFDSLASNLAPRDTNGVGDVFLRDRKLKVTHRVSVGPNARQANRDSYGPAISRDGRFVVFYSHASNLVPGDTNRRSDVFVRDRKLRVTYRVSVGPNGRQANGPSLAPAISPGGRFVTFGSSASNLVPRDTNRRSDVFVRDRKLRVTHRVSVGPNARQANGESGRPSISAGGRFVAFGSLASNLVAVDTNGAIDVFVRDRKLRVTHRVSVGPNGLQADNESYAPAISADGRSVVFWSYASNLVAGDTGPEDVFVSDR
jgi:Tol biopolymer transport system component